MNEFLDALADLEREKGINKEVLLEAIESALISAYRRNFGSAQNVVVRIDRDSGEPHVYAQRTAVPSVTDPRLEIDLEQARTQVPGVQEGDIVEVEVTPKSFGRIAAQTAKQVIVQRIREAERGIIYEEFSGREGDIVSGMVHRIERRMVFVDLGRAEAVMLQAEQTPGEVLRPGDRIKAYVTEVRKTTKGPQIFISRTHPGLVKRLLELEVPEIHDGVVEIKGIAREAGARSKIAVWSDNPDVDPVGSCIGPRKARIQAIVQELRGEKLDIVRWDPDPAVMVANALSPAHVTEVRVDGADKVAHVVVPDGQLSLAIGKEGQNARLAARLTGWKVDIRSESQVGVGGW